MAAPGTRPLVSVIMPIRNESTFIAESLGAVLGQDYPADLLEVVVVDGGSTDDTPAVVATLLAGAPNPSVLLDNPRRIVPVSMNLGLERATGDVVVRVDGHCVVAPDYVSRCVDLLAARPDVDCVGGPMATVAEGPTGRAIAAAQSSRVGVGGVAFRTSDREALVDTLAFGAYRREVFDRIGVFDEALVRNQDDELNLRLTRSGGLILLHPDVRSTYFSRADLRSLARQYKGYGRYKVAVMRKHSTVPSPRHLAPGAFVAAVGTSLALGAATRRRWLAASVVVPYASVVAGASLHTARSTGTSAPTVAAATAVMHVAYGVGFLRGVLDLAVGRGPGAAGG